MKELYLEWCKETKRSGGVLVGGSIYEFFDWLAFNGYELNKQSGVLYGEDAERFIKQMQENQNKKASPEQLAEIKKSAEAMEKILKKGKL